MGVFHYLNVRDGDCSIIQHPSGHITVIDVCNAKSEEMLKETIKKAFSETSVLGNFRQKDEPVNPISYLKGLGIDSIFRFIGTHPDMDHLDGLKALFDEVSPTNFWDTDNDEEKDFTNTKFQKYDEEDWNLYKSLRDENSKSNPKRLVLYSGASGKYYNQDENGSGGGDGLHILAPNEELIKQAKESGDYNDASYVILYKSNGGRILLSGDSHDNTWEYLLKNNKAEVKDVDLLIAPHHGRKSNRSYDFLKIVNPALTFFGNADSKDLAYQAWSSRSLPVITNNQANCMVVDTNSSPMAVYVTNKKFAETFNPETLYSEEFGAYYIGKIGR